MAPQSPPTEVVELSTGVKLRILRVRQSVITEVMNRFQRPQPPRVWIESKGRSEENPDHPDYIKALEDYELHLATAVNDAVLLTGSEIESVPEGVEKLEDTKWRAKARRLGMIGPDSDEASLYLAWLKMVGTYGEDDYKLIWEAAGRISGVSEKQVAKRN